jgi:hypothetical protein
MRILKLSTVLIATVGLAGAASAQTAAKPDMKNPAAMTAQAPPTFKANFETSAGNFVIEVTRVVARLARIALPTSYDLASSTTSASSGR